MSVAALLLFWRLGAVYLWQDEANTAVLAVRMLKYGRPLAYDGVNLLTNDNLAAEDRATIGDRTADPQAALKYIIHRGDLKADGSWLYHPWGQFIVAAGSIKALGATTLAPRLPFALAGLASVLLLYWLARSSTGSPHIALLASAMLAGNSYWILHSRQARYYALSSLFLLVTLLAYQRWQRGSRWGATAFVAAAWGWFQVDYGTVWPVLGVLFLHATIVHRRKPWTALVPAVALAAIIAPFLFFYEMWGRLSVQLGTWNERFFQNLFNTDRFVISGLVLIVAAAVLVLRWKRIADSERRLALISIGILCGLLLWVPTVAPRAFLRYIIMAAPVGCLVTAWVLVRGLASWPRAAIWLAAAFVVLSPWLSAPVEGLAPLPQLRANGAVIRPELSMMIDEVFKPRRDPNRLVVEWLREHAAPTDDILINYEDTPLIYYLPNPIRGGVAAFRAEDDTKKPPTFIVLRRSVLFVHWPVFNREFNRYTWEEVASRAPDVVWGNNPDPFGKIQNPDTIRDLFIARRREARTP